jgi:hypothetical protein
MSNRNISSIIVEAGSVGELDLPRLRSNVSENSVGIIRGCVNADDVIKSVSELRRLFSPSKDLVISPENVEKENFQRLLIGTSGDPFQLDSPGQFLRVFYNSLESADIYRMHNTFSTLIEIRDRLSGVPSSESCLSDNAWNAARIHQYPSGGGFMSAHTDRISKVSKELGIDYFQMVLVMSQKGLDFSTGGAFVVSNNTTIMLDEYTNLGDIIVYNGQAVHGVAKIDGHMPLDISCFSGRLAGLVTLYAKQRAFHQ